MRKRATLFAVVAIGSALTVGLAACDSTSTASPSTSASAKSTPAASTHPLPTDVPTACTPKTGGSNGKLLVGMVGITTQGSFFGQVDQGMQDVATKAGVDLQLVDGQIDATVQANAVQTLVTKGANVIMVDPLDTSALRPSVDAAIAAGIPVVTFDGPLTGDSKVSTFVGVSNEAGGKQVGKYLASLSKGKGSVGEIAALNSSIQIERQTGFDSTVKAAGMTIGTVVDGQNDTDKAQTAAENLFTANPDLKYVYATGQPALDGAVAAAKSQSATDRVQMVGWDLSTISAGALKAGYVKAVLQQDTFGEGQEAAKAAITVACGGTVPKTIPVATHLVTKATLSKYSYFLGE